MFLNEGRKLDQMLSDPKYFAYLFRTFSQARGYPGVDGDIVPPPFYLYIVYYLTSSLSPNSEGGRFLSFLDPLPSFPVPPLSFLMRPPSVDLSLIFFLFRLFFIIQFIRMLSTAQKSC